MAAKRGDLLLYGGLGLVGLGGYLYFSGAKPGPAPAPGSLPGPGASLPLCAPTDAGQPPSYAAGMWIRSQLGWYPNLPPNLPPGWAPGQAAPQPIAGVANTFIWTGAGWVPNPKNPPAGWSFVTTGTPLVAPTKIGQPPAGQLGQWMRTGLGWFPIPSNVPPGWVPGQVAPQPLNATAPFFIWTGSAWVPNPGRMPGGWTL